MEGKDAEQGTGPKELSISRPTQFWIELERLKTEEGDKKQPEYFKSPFEETRSLDGIPEITAYTDTHSNSRQLSRYGYKGLASGKRMFYGLSKIPWIRNKARRIDVLSRVAMHTARSDIQERHRKGGILANLGDCVDAVEAGSVFHSYVDVERYHEARRESAEKKDEELFFLQLDGNHYAFRGPETKLDYDPIHKENGTLDVDTFREIVTALEDGTSWRNILAAWDRSRRVLIERGEIEHKQIAIHPAQKWYFEKIAFGTQIGRFTKREGEDEKVTSQVVFLNSELFRRWSGFRPEDLRKSLDDIDLEPSDPLYKNMMDKLEEERKANKNVMKEALKDALSGAKTTIYTHNAEPFQGQLIEMIKEDEELKKEFEETNGGSSEEEFVQNNITIYGGHLHLGERDFGKRKKGTVSLRAMTRAFIGSVPQQPIPKNVGEITESLKRPYESEINFPEILVGDALSPKIKGIEGVDRDFDRLFATAKNWTQLENILEEK